MASVNDIHLNDKKCLSTKTCISSLGNETVHYYLDNIFIGCITYYPHNRTPLAITIHENYECITYTDKNDIKNKYKYLMNKLN